MLEEKIIGYAENGVYKIIADIKAIKCGKYWAKDVPEFLGGECDGIYSGGDGSFIVCINNAEKEHILNYINTLEQKGYKKFSQSEMNNNLFFTYENGENYVYAYFIDSLKTVKIIAEPYYEYVNFTPEKNIYLTFRG